jgi:hypothetical protein
MIDIQTQDTRLGVEGDDVIIPDYTAPGTASARRTMVVTQ